MQKKGALFSIDIPTDFIVKKENIKPEIIKKWEGDYSFRLWGARPSWLIKPFVMLNSPYRRTVWFDIDCQVRKSIKPLFEYCDHPSGLALAIEPEGNLKKDPEYDKTYNSGVVVFKHGSPIMIRWAEGLYELNDTFVGDQQILSRIIDVEKLKVGEFPIDYNWIYKLGPNPTAAIIHWIASGKKVIDLQISLFKNLLIDLTL